LVPSHRGNCQAAGAAGHEADSMLRDVEGDTVVRGQPLASPTR
jgi:hypothetical protein